MKRIAVLSIILIIALSIPCSVFAASDVSGALYKMDITVHNSAVDATNVITVASISTPGLITGGFSNDSVTNLAMLNDAGADVVFMPGYDTNPWCIFVPEINQYDYSTYQLYTAESIDGEIMYSPGSSGMNPNFTPTGYSTNWSAEIKGYFDTSYVASPRYIATYSSGSTFDVYVSAAGSITAYMVVSGKSVTASGTTSGVHII
jgi:hypothetical protein